MQVKTKGDSETHITQYALHSKPVDISRCMKILAHPVNHKGENKTRDRQILQATNNNAVLRCILGDKRTPLVAENLSAEDIGVGDILDLSIPARRKRSREYF